MGASNLLGILGLIATVIFGLLSLLLFLRRRYPGQLTFVREHYIPLFDAIVRNMPELQVLFHESPVKENLVLIRGHIVNSGSVDLAESAVEKPLQVNLPDRFRWITARVVSSSPKLKAKASVKSERDVEFELGLFRKDESFCFEALIEVPHDKLQSNKQMRPDPTIAVKSAINFSHRIADTGSVVKQSIPVPLSRRRKVLLSIMAAYFLFFMVFMFVRTIWYPTYELIYSIKMATGSNIEAIVIPEASGSISVKSRDRKTVEQISPSEFTARLSSVRVAQMDNVYLTFLNLIVVTLSPLVIFGPVVRDIFRLKRYRRVLKLVESDKDVSECSIT